MEKTEGIEPADPQKWSEGMRQLESVREWIKENLVQAFERQANRYNLRQRHRTFNVGDQVLKR